MASLSELGRFIKITAAGGLLATTLVDCVPSGVSIPTPIAKVAPKLSPTLGPAEDLHRIVPTPAGEILPIQGEKDMRITNAPAKFINIPTPPNSFDKMRLQGLYSSLQQESGIREQRINTIRDNLSIVLGNEGNNGTSLRINEDGTFLTVAHNFTRGADGKTLVTTSAQSVQLNTGVVAPINGVYLDLTSDIALYQAADGTPSKPVDNIQLDPNPLEPGTQVWLMSINQLQGSERFDLHMDTGMVVPSPEIEILTKRGFTYARGIRGISGTSGGPIINKEGIIVGVIKGTVAETINGRVTDELTVIVPISKIQNLLEQSELYTLPIK